MIDYTINITWAKVKKSILNRIHQTIYTLIINSTNFVQIYTSLNTLHAHVLNFRKFIFNQLTVRACQVKTHLLKCMHCEGFTGSVQFLEFVGYEKGLVGSMKNPSDMCSGLLHIRRVSWVWIYWIYVRYLDLC